MHVNFKVSTSEEYFSQVEKEIDWEEDNDSKVPVKQASLIGEILAMEVSIFLLRRATGICGSLVDAMISARKELVRKYENNYEAYTEYNDFY